MPSSSFYTKTYTATADTPFQVDSEYRTILTSVNIHCYTFDAYYGSRSNQEGIIRSNAVVWFDKPVRVSDLWFKNLTAGSNCVITITGTLQEE